MTIKNYGLMWERDKVNWSGVRGRAGHLKGMGPVDRPKNQQGEANFREQAGMYILYEYDNPVYVGQTGSGHQTLYKRLKDHTEDHLADRWEKFSWFGVRYVKQNGELSEKTSDLSRQIKLKDFLNLVEGLLIKSLEPTLNKQGAKWAGIHQYYQIIEGWSSWSERDMLERLLNESGVSSEE